MFIQTYNKTVDQMIGGLIILVLLVLISVDIAAGGAQPFVNIVEDSIHGVAVLFFAAAHGLVDMRCALDKGKVLIGACRVLIYRFGRDILPACRHAHDERGNFYGLNVSDRRAVCAAPVNAPEAVLVIAVIGQRTDCKLGQIVSDACKKNALAVGSRKRGFVLGAAHRVRSPL